jgi:uncharacterized protein (UPF0335 family)
MTREKKRRRAPAQELLRNLGPRPGWEAQRLERIRQLNALEKLLDGQERPLMAELLGAGVGVKSVNDLVNRRTPYSAAVPVLLKHLSQPYHENLADMIARALAVPEARYAWDFIVSEYKGAPHLRSDGLDSQRKNALALAVAGALPPERWDDFIALIRDRSNGGSRILMLRKIERSKREDKDELLDELSKDKDLSPEIGEIRKRQASARKRRALAEARKSLH